MKTAFSLTLALGLSIGATAYPAIIDVTVSGKTDGNSGGPYMVSGGFSFDTDLATTTDLDNVNILDPGIFDFSVAFSGGSNPQIFDSIDIASGIAGSFDLSTDGKYSDIVNSATCISGPGNVGICSRLAVGALMSFERDGVITYSPPGLTDLTAKLIPPTYEIVTRPMSPVPLPAGLPLILTGLAGFATLRLRHKRKAQV